jgi:DNA-directed RNA polymerase subunit omega
MLVDRDNDKNPVVSLREIADTDISLENLKESLIKNYQKVIEIEEEEEEILDIMDGENEWAQVANQAAETEIADAGLQEDFAADEGAEGDTADADSDIGGEAASDAIADDAGFEDETV